MKKLVAGLAMFMFCLCWLVGLISMWLCGCSFFVGFLVVVFVKRVVDVFCCFCNAPFFILSSQNYRDLVAV